MQLKLMASTIPVESPMAMLNDGSVRYKLGKTWVIHESETITNVLLRWWIQVGVCVFTKSQNSERMLAIDLPKMFNGWLKNTSDLKARKLYADLMLKALDNSMSDDEMFDKFGFSPNTVFSSLYKVKPEK
jgi:hypothetical protein